MKIGIISAMDDEHRQLAERLSDKRENTEGTFRYVEGCAGDNELVLTQCGIGKVNAAIGAVELIRRYHPDCVISTGVAGGMAGCLRVGDVVVGESMVYHDVWCGDGNAYGQIQDMPAVYRGNQTLLECARRLNEQDIESSVHTGLICTGDQFVTEQEVQESIRTHFPDVMAVDMESAAIAQTPQFPHHQRYAWRGGALESVLRLLGYNGRPFVPNYMGVPLHLAPRTLTA